VRDFWADKRSYLSAYPSVAPDGHDDYFFATNLSGFSVPSQVGREFRMEAGTAVLLSSSDVGAKDFPCRQNF
jgi:hypothetical protein